MPLVCVLSISIFKKRLIVCMPNICSPRVEINKLHLCRQMNDKYEESLQACINAHDFNLAFQMVSLLKYDQNQKEEISQQFIEIYSSSQSYLVRRNIEFMKIYQIFCRN